jgi:hypothetical protein
VSARLRLLIPLIAGLGCPADPGGDTEDTAETGDTSAPAPPARVAQRVRVTLDGAPVADVVVAQPGRPGLWRTDAEGLATVELAVDVSYEVWVTASHPTARTEGRRVRDPGEGVVEVPLVRYVDVDNPAYSFQDPGTPFRNDSTSQCSHCHVTINEDWYGSMHASAASNPVVHDLYAGTSTHASRAACEAAGGRWASARTPGDDAPSERCHVGPSVLADLDPTCDVPPCEGPPADVGGCADCHAPGIDGALGGRDLLDARGVAFEGGVHCDVCHKVESVHLDEAPGVAGRLRLLRPSEPSPSDTLGTFLPLSFGPHHDVPNPRMGNVQRDHFSDATLCAGCHEDVHAPRVPGATADPARWPDGRLPIQTTYSEWRDGPLGGAAPCQSCHMPPDARVTNSADLQIFQLFEGSGDLASGWPRPAGAVRRHTFVGPRDPEGRMLELSAEVAVVPQVIDDAVRAEVTVRNVGPGHALPTGEPMRHLVLRVAARCGDAPLRPVGGDVIPDFGGALAIQERGADWSRWPGARVGERIRVVERPGTFHDPPGTGPFGDGTFSPAEKGMPVERFVGEARIVGVDGDRVTLEGPLPAGDRAYRVDDDGWIGPGDDARAAAGGPGFAFGKVLVDGAGSRQVPAHRAVDVASDNRLPPGAAYTTTHTFALDGCADPEVGATLTWRAYPVGLARQKAWHNPERSLTTTWRRP